MCGTTHAAGTSWEITDGLFALLRVVRHGDDNSLVVSTDSGTIVIHVSCPVCGNLHLFRAPTLIGRIGRTPDE